jgi:hypothetical protein
MVFCQRRRRGLLRVVYGAVVLQQVTKRAREKREEV